MAASAGADELERRGEAERALAEALGIDAGNAAALEVKRELER